MTMERLRAFRVAFHGGGFTYLCRRNEGREPTRLIEISQPPILFGKSDTHWSWICSPECEIVCTNRSELTLEDSSLTLETYWAGDPPPEWYAELLRWS